jgi:hypothetical protein
MEYSFADLDKTVLSMKRELIVRARSMLSTSARPLSFSRHMSLAFLSEAVGQHDKVFGSLNAEKGKKRYQDVTGNLALSDGMAVSN